MKHIFVVACAGLMAVAAACTGGGSSSPPPDGSCTSGQVQCEGRELQTCQNGAFATAEVCDVACSEELGACAACDPGVGSGCDENNNIVGCGPDGTLGQIIESCGSEQQCVNGACSDECTADGVDLIYVVDDTNTLYSFDPRKISQGQNAAFTSLGNLNCNTAGTSPVQGWGGGVTPFSMAVDRDAVAKVLYTNGHIYNVSTTAGSVTCTDSGYAAQGGAAFRLFGMGYVSDTAGSDTETLFVSGSMHVQGLDCAEETYCGTLGSINGSAALSSIGQLPQAQQEAELTGDGNGQLWAFFPGASTASVKPINKTNGTAGTTINIPGGLGGNAQAWAFAHWGGKFYIFVTVVSGNTTNSKVLVLDKQGAVTTAFQNLPMMLVGAGVSTCAPVVEPPIS